MTNCNCQVFRLSQGFVSVDKYASSIKSNCQLETPRKVRAWNSKGGDELKTCGGCFHTKTRSLAPTNAVKKRQRPMRGRLCVQTTPAIDEMQGRTASSRCFGGEAPVGTNGEDKRRRMLHVRSLPWRMRRLLLPYRPVPANSPDS